MGSHHYRIIGLPSWVGLSYGRRKGRKIFIYSVSFFPNEGKREDESIGRGITYYLVTFHFLFKLGIRSS